jgi:hypothetical protein
VPIPIAGVGDALRQVAAAFGPVFTAPLWVHFVTGLLGLLQTPDQRTLVGPRRGVAGAKSLSAPSSFVATAPRAPAAPAAAWQARFREQLAPRIQEEHVRKRTAGCAGGGAPCGRG